MHAGPESHHGQPSPCTLPVFTCGQRFFFQSDILSFAARSGELEAHTRAWVERSEALRLAREAGLEADPGEVEAFLEAFRYARDLVSGEECEAWLAKLGLTFADLVAFAQGRVLAGMPQDQEQPAAEEEEPVEDAGEEAEPGEAEVEGVPGGEEAQEEPDVYPALDTDRPPAAELVLDDAFAGWARGLARRMAAAAEAGVMPADEASCDWDAVEGAFAEAKLGAAGDEARLARLRADWMDLLRVGIEAVELDSADAAREALLCVREEGMTFGQLAEENGLPLRSACGFLADYGEEMRRPLAAARAGDLLTLATESGMHLALRVTLREEPVLADPAVVGRLDAALVEARLAALEAQHVRWIVRLDTEQ